MAKGKKKVVDGSALLADAVVKGMLEKKGRNIVCLDLREIDNAVCDHFIICHGDSNTQVDAIANSVIDEVGKDRDDKPWHKEGFDNAEWILLDYVNVVAHVFLHEVREFYDLEGLWADAKTTEVEMVY